MPKETSKLQSIKLLTIGQGINTVVNLLFLPYLARTMSYEEYGSYGQTLLVVDLFKTLLMMGIPQLVFVYLSQKKESENAIVTNSFFSGLLLGAIGVLLLLLSNTLLAGLFNNERIGVLIVIYSISALFHIPMQNLNSVLVFRHRIKQSVLIQVLGNLLKIGLVFISVQYYSSLELVMLSLVVSSAFQMLLSIYFTHSDFKKNLLSFQTVLTQIKQGFPLGITGVIGTIMLASDGYLVSAFLSIKEYAIFRNGALEVPFVSIVYGSIAAIILPEVSKLFYQNKFTEIVELKRSTMKNTAAIIYPIMAFLMYFSKDAVSFYLGDMYVESGAIFMVYTFALFIRINDYSDVLISAKKNMIILVAYASSLIINIGLSILFIKYFGAIGAAIATIISLFVLAGIQLFYTVRLLNVSVFRFIDVKSIIIVLFISFCLLFGLGSVFPFLNSKPMAAIAILGYFVLIYLSLYRLKIIDKRIAKAIIPKFLQNGFR